MRYFLSNNYKQTTTSLSLSVGTIVPERLHGKQIEQTDE